MKSAILKGIVIIGIILLIGHPLAAQPQQLSDAELEQVSAGAFMDFDMFEQMLGDMMLLAEAGTLANINAINSATLVQSNFNVNEIGSGEIVNINTAEVINQIASSNNTLTLSDSAQSSLTALANINAVNSAVVVQSNFNFNVDSCTNTNTATVINTR
ncbi:MAG: hypothetical protein P9L93_04280 [Candidatus Gorgyraea atricola]|nr:hypothetical protein [Candidatus Gorgyraea atricola]